MRCNIEATAERNLELMLEANKKGGMNHLLKDRTLIGARDVDTFADFYFDRSTGEIVHFGYDKDKQNNVPSQYARGRFGIVMNKRLRLEIADVFIVQGDGYHSKAISEAPNISNPAREALEKTVQAYNSSQKNEIKHKNSRVRMVNGLLFSWVPNDTLLPDKSAKRPPCQFS